MKKPVYIVDIIGDVVAKVSEALTPALKIYDPTITNVNYMYGPPKEINNTLTDWTTMGKDADKYPIIMLLQSFPETFGNLNIETVNLHMIIARRNSNPKLKSSERYANNFKPVLYPVYYELLNQMTSYVGITTNGYIPHTKTDWPFWGGTEDQSKNPFNDKIDIIELRFSNLTINLKKC